MFNGRKNMYSFLAAKYTKRIDQMKTKIKVTFDVPGYHYWKSAPEAVAFLRSSHRHIFVYIVTLKVYHHDREVEFFLLQDELRSWVVDKYPMGLAGAINFGPSSCEHLAQEVIDYIMERYPGRNCSVEVSEDGTNSSIVIFEKEDKGG